MLRHRVDTLCVAYRADPRYLAVVRMLFAAYVIAFPIDYEWTNTVPDALFQPRPGPFALMSAPPPDAVATTLEIGRLILAVAILVGYRTVLSSIAMTIVLVAGSGLVHSYGKVDHFILFELLPAVLAAAGWGAAWSVDARRRMKHGALDGGLVMLLWALTVAFALFTAALPKAVSGWLDPNREATRGYVARDVADPTKLGPFTDQVFAVDSHLIWKVLDFATVFAEGWLILAILVPTLFRIGLAVLLVFHLGVYLSMGIEFDSYVFVYLPFFSPPAMWLAHRAFRSRERHGLNDDLRPVAG